MRKLFYMGLEPYEGRYTLQLQDWSERAFKKRHKNEIIFHFGPIGPFLETKIANPRLLPFSKK